MPHTPPATDLCRLAPQSAGGQTVVVAVMAVVVVGVSPSDPSAVRRAVVRASHCGWSGSWSVVVLAPALRNSTHDHVHPGWGPTIPFSPTSDPTCPPLETTYPQRCTCVLPTSIGVGGPTFRATSDHSPLERRILRGVRRIRLVTNATVQTTTYVHRMTCGAQFHHVWAFVRSHIFL